MKNTEQYTRKINLLFFVLTVISIGGIVWTLKTIGIDSAWSWSFKQNDYWIAILELFILFLLLVAVLCVPKKRQVRVAGVFLVVGIFSYLHSFFYAFLAGCLYAVMIFMTGELLCGFFCRDWREDIPACMLLGIEGIIVLVALCSYAKIGTSDKLRVVYMILFVLECILCRKKLGTFISGTWKQVDNKEDHSLGIDLIIAGIITAFMIQLGRACIALDYDSLWYGLRSDSILAPFTGIYDRVISTGSVYVYPKGVETLALAFNFPSTYSFVYAVNLMFAAILLYITYRIVRLFCGKTIALFATLCCSVTPGIMNMAVTAKSDIVTLLIQLLIVYFVIYAIQKKSGSALMLSISAALFSFCFKPSSLIFTVILMIPAVVLFVLSRIKVKGKDLLIMVLPLCANFALMLRTWLLTGMPMTSFGINLFQKIGFSYRFPYAEASSDYVLSLSDFFGKGVIWERLPRLFQFLFSPLTGDMDHVIISWCGILFSLTWILLVIRVFSNPKRTWKKMCGDRAYAYSLTAVAIISVASMGSMLLLKKPDGNYFILMYAMTFLHAAIEMRDFSGNISKQCCRTMIPLTICGGMLCLLTSWSWCVGFTPVNLDNKGFYNHEKENQTMFEDMGLGNIYKKLADEGGKSRLMMISNQGPRALSLPAIVDSWLDFSYWGNKELSYTADGIYAYLQVSGVEYVLIEREAIGADEQRDGNLLSLAQDGYFHIEMYEEKYILIRFVENGGEVDMMLCDYFLGK